MNSSIHLQTSFTNQQQQDLQTSFMSQCKVDSKETTKDFWLPLVQDVELSVPSSGLCLPAVYNVYCHDDTALNASNYKIDPIKLCLL